MSEGRGGDWIARSLTDVRAEVVGYVNPPGAAAAARTVRRRKRNRVVAVAVLAMALLVAPAAVLRTYDGPGREGGATTTPSSDPEAVWRDFVTCARSHGQPDWPDPVVNKDGSATFPPPFNSKDRYEAVRGACAAILDRLPSEVRPTLRQTR
jgi:hypothetical protein